MWCESNREPPLNQYNACVWTKDSTAQPDNAASSSNHRGRGSQKMERRFDKWVCSERNQLKLSQPAFPSLKGTLESLSNWRVFFFFHWGVSAYRANTCYANGAEKQCTEDGELPACRGSTRFFSSCCGHINIKTERHSLRWLCLLLQGVLHWKIQLLPSWSQSCQQVTQEAIETNPP